MGGERERERLRICGSDSHASKSYNFYPPLPLSQADAAAADALHRMQQAEQQRHFAAAVAAVSAAQATQEAADRDRRDLMAAHVVARRMSLTAKLPPGAAAGGRRGSRSFPDVARPDAQQLALPADDEPLQRQWPSSPVGAPSPGGRHGPSPLRQGRGGRRGGKRLSIEVGEGRGGKRLSIEVGEGRGGWRMGLRQLRHPPALPSPPQVDTARPGTASQDVTTGWEANRPGTADSTGGGWGGGGGISAHWRYAGDASIPAAVETGRQFAAAAAAAELAPGDVGSMTWTARTSKTPRAGASGGGGSGTQRAPRGVPSSATPAAAAAASGGGGEAHSPGAAAAHADPLLRTPAGRAALAAVRADERAHSRMEGAPQSADPAVASAVAAALAAAAASGGRPLSGDALRRSPGEGGAADLFSLAHDTVGSLALQASLQRVATAKAADESAARAREAGGGALDGGGLGDGRDEVAELAILAALNISRTG